MAKKRFLRARSLVSYSFSVYSYQQINLEVANETLITASSENVVWRLKNKVQI